MGESSELTPSLKWVDALSANERDRLAEKIRLERLRRGLTQRQLSELADIAPGTLVAFETGTRTPHAQNLRKLVSALDIEDEKIVDPEIESWLSALRVMVENLELEHKRRVMAKVMQLTANTVVEQAKTDYERMMENF